MVGLKEQNSWVTGSYAYQGILGRIDGLGEVGETLVGNDVN